LFPLFPNLITLLQTHTHTFYEKKITVYVQRDHDDRDAGLGAIPYRYR
jgi:hypothetical protein